jgi:hypothetical protein
MIPEQVDGIFNLWDEVTACLDGTERDVKTVAMFVDLCLKLRQAKALERIADSLENGVIDVRDSRL